MVKIRIFETILLLLSTIFKIKINISLERSNFLGLLSISPFFTFWSTQFSRINIKGLYNKITITKNQAFQSLSLFYTTKERDMILVNAGADFIFVG